MKYILQLLLLTVSYGAHKFFKHFSILVYASCQPLSSVHTNKFLPYLKQGQKDDEVGRLKFSHVQRILKPCQKPAIFFLFSDFQQKFLVNSIS